MPLGNPSILGTGGSLILCITGKPIQSNSMICWQSRSEPVPSLGLEPTVFHTQTVKPRCLPNTYFDIFGPSFESGVFWNLIVHAWNVSLFIFLIAWS